MPLLLLILLLSVLVYMWIARRNSTLTRACMWRQERAMGQWRCASCGAVVRAAREPKDCLRPKG